MQRGKNEHIVQIISKFPKGIKIAQDNINNFAAIIIQQNAKTTVYLYASGNLG